MSQGSRGVDKLAWLKERGYIRDFERKSCPDWPLYFEVLTTDGVVHEWRFREVERFHSGVVACRIRHDIHDEDPDSIGAWLRRAREHALATGEDADEVAPGVLRAEAKAAAAHAVLVQKGYSTPEIEAERLSADRARRTSDQTSE